MSEFFNIVGSIIGDTIALAIIAIVSGTLLWLIYPYSIPMLSPKLVEFDIIVSKLSWLSSVSIAGVFLLFMKLTSVVIKPNKSE